MKTSVCLKYFVHNCSFDRFANLFFLKIRVSNKFYHNLYLRTKNLLINNANPLDNNNCTGVVLIYLSTMFGRNQRNFIMIKLNTCDFRFDRVIFVNTINSKSRGTTETI